MPIRGLGVDVAEVGRVRALLGRHPAFSERCFTAAEREYAACHPRSEQRLAARFAAKEAVMKCLGSGWREVAWKDVEITGGGVPTVVLHGRAAARAAARGVTGVLVSLTHTEEMAVAVAVAVGG